MKFNFLGPSNPLDPINADVERTINLYPELTGPGSPKARLTLRATPGRAVLTVIPNATSVPLLYANGADPTSGRCFGIAGPIFYELTQNAGMWAATIWGTVATPTNSQQQTTICTNGQGGHQLFIVTGGCGYIFNLQTNSFSQITDTNFPTGTCLMGDYMGSFFVALNGSNSSIILSNQEDGTAWQALLVAQRQNSPDNALAIKVFRNELWWFGPLTTEVWYNSGAANFPFTAVQGGLMQIGISDPRTIKELDNALWFAGHETTQGRDLVYQATTYSPTRVSTHAVEDAINTALASGGLTFGVTYEEDGHSFYGLRLPVNSSWYYDQASQLWHERGIYNSGTDDFDPDPVISHTFFAGTHLVGDAATGTVWQASLDQYQDEVVV